MRDMSPNLVKAREALLKLRQSESAKSFTLMAAFLKDRNGDVSQKEMAELFRTHGMPFPAREYVAARDKAGVPLRKPLVRGHSRARANEIRDAWAKLLARTPEAKLPRIAKLNDVPKPNGTPEPAPESAKSTPAALWLREVSTEDLITEMERRKDEARRLFALLAGGARMPEDKP